MGITFANSSVFVCERVAIVEFLQT
uniref:Uncharacterized protein n=1 Tax=Rhizophora mucronata TaxID=61149 RepID=A0A2P2NQ67_RHIMU